MNRDLVFHLGCIPVRIALAQFAHKIPYMRYISAAVGATWLLGLPKRAFGFAGGPAWWAPYRPLHGAIWLGYAATEDNSWLMMDAAVGLLLKTNH